jgi:hypothetical protein
VQVYFGIMVSSLEHIRAGKVRALAVTTATRSAALPDIPTVGESVAGYEASAWWGIGAPRNTPVEIIEKLNKEINAALADPKIKAQLADLGGTTLGGSPADFGKLIANDVEKWGKVIKFADIKAELIRQSVGYSVTPVRRKCRLTALATVFRGAPKRHRAVRGNHASCDCRASGLLLQWRMLAFDDGAPSPA